MSRLQHIAADMLSAWLAGMSLTQAVSAPCREGSGSVVRLSAQFNSMTKKCMTCRHDANAGKPQQLHTYLSQ